MGPLPETTRLTVNLEGEPLARVKRLADALDCDLVDVPQRAFSFLEECVDAELKGGKVILTTSAFAPPEQLRLVKREPTT